MRNNIIVRDPFREFDNLVRRSFGPSAFESVEPGFVPAVETARDGEDAVIRVELPGVDIAEDVDVEVTDGRLVISGERRDQRDEETDGRHLREIRYGSFRRAFRLGRGVTADAVTASYDAGVLQVRVAGAYSDPAGQKIAISTGTPGAVPAGESAEPTEG